jgi:hypothetical protein
MKNRFLVISLILGLGLAWAGMSLAGDIGYRFRDESPGLTRVPGPPSSAVMAFDALLARPLGAAATVVGTSLFVVTLPMSGATSTADEAAWGLVGRPFNYTFNRPLGRSNPKFEEEGVFRP